MRKEWSGSGRAKIMVRIRHMVRNGEESPERGCVTYGQCGQGGRYRPSLDTHLDCRDAAKWTLRTRRSTPVYGVLCCFVGVWHHGVNAKNGRCGRKLGGQHDANV
jgi:hypothetical protein